MPALTNKQIDALSRLDQYQGQRVLVVTSEYELGKPRVAGDKGLFNASTLRGLAKKGLIKMEPIWRGAWVTVPKRESLAAAIHEDFFAPCEKLNPKPNSY